MANIIIFDTETTSLDKPFCYNIGYVVANPETWEILVKRDFVVEQIWHNEALFSSAYYADKRPLYVQRMRSRRAKMDKYGYIMRQMIRDVDAFEIVGAYAYNSNFDERVFNFNCDWYKCSNPFDTVPIYDIRGYAHYFLCGDEFKVWCEDHKRFTETGNYSTTAETLFQYVTGETDFEEEHTALADSVIEAEILRRCVEKGAELGENYKAFRSLPRIAPHPFTIKVNDEIIYSGEYISKKESKAKGIYTFRCLTEE